MAIKLLDSWSDGNGLYICPYCGVKRKRKGICSHIQRMHGDGTEFKPFIGHTAQNKGLNEHVDNRVKQYVESIRNGYKTGKIINHQKGKEVNFETRQKISSSMKKAHSEGRAWNIGKSRQNNKPSQPEKFFMMVIINEFIDRDVTQEYPISNNNSSYSLDFAQPHKLKAIEIDGEQHQRFDDYKKRDEKKDFYLRSIGQKILRISQKNLQHDTKYQISVAKKFID